MHVQRHFIRRLKVLLDIQQKNDIHFGSLLAAQVLTGVGEGRLLTRPASVPQRHNADLYILRTKHGCLPFGSL